MSAKGKTPSSDVTSEPRACSHGVDRRGFLTAGSVGLGAAALAAAGALAPNPARAGASSDPYADPAEPMLPASDMAVDERTALVITDPQIDFLDPSGAAWGAVGGGVEANGTVANIGRLLDAAKAVAMTVAISPHYYYPSDHGWRFSGPLEKLMHAIGMFDRPSAYSTEGLAGSGADFMPQYKAQILDGRTIVASPHKPGFPRWLLPIAEKSNTIGIPKAIPTRSCHDRLGSALDRVCLAMRNSAP